MSRGVTEAVRCRLFGINLHLPSTTCLNKPHNIPLITILKTLAKRFILVMSRHRFVRTLNPDGE